MTPGALTGLESVRKQREMYVQNRMAGLLAIVLFLAGTASSAKAQGHNIHPPMPGQKYHLKVTFEGDKGKQQIQVPLDLPMPTAPITLDQAIKLPAPLAPIRATRYLPQASLEQRVTEDTSDRSTCAMQLTIKGPSQSFDRWLVAGDALRNRLTSLIGTWRYMEVKDKAERDTLYEEFETEFTRDPRLRVASAGGGDTQVFGVKTGTVKTLEKPKCRITVLEFYPHYAKDDKTGKPTNVSYRRMNPAVHVKIEADGKTEKRWIFSKFPDFAAGEGDKLPLLVKLDCPAQAKVPAPDVVLLTVGRKTNEVWVRYDGKITAAAFAADEPVKLPNSQYEFTLTRFVAHGKLVEVYVPATGRGGTPALLVEVPGELKGSKTDVWLALNRPAPLQIEGRAVTALFALDVGGAGGGHP